MKTRPGQERGSRPAGKDAPPPEPEGRRKPKELLRDEDQPARYEDPVDEASEASMIASDPPARSGVRIGPAKRRRSEP